MTKSKIAVNTSPVAGHYARYADEKIIEFDSPNGGGLLAFRVRDNGELWLEPYRLDETVRVNIATEHLARRHDDAVYYTIAPADVGNRTIRTPHGHIDVSDIVGRISHRDIGRRVHWATDDRVEGNVHYSAESDRERSGRIAAFLATRDWISVRETIRHGDFHSVNTVGGPSVNYAVRQLLSVSPYHADADGDTATRIAVALIDKSHTEHGWAQYDLLMD